MFVAILLPLLAILTQVSMMAVIGLVNTKGFAHAWKAQSGMMVLFQYSVFWLPCTLPCFCLIKVNTATTIQLIQLDNSMRLYSFTLGQTLCCFVKLCLTLRVDFRTN